VEDLEGSDGDDEEVRHPEVAMPEYESSNVEISVKSKKPVNRNEAQHVKENLLLPEDNFSNVTDTESLDGEANRDA